MQEEKELEKFGPEIVIDQEYVRNALEGNIEFEFTEDQWNEFYDRIGGPLYCAIYDTVQEIVGQAELIENNKDAGNAKPYYLLKYKHPNAYVNDWKEVGPCFKTEADAQAYIKYEHGGGLDEEWKVELVE
jgi:hypothetical protein